MKILLMIIFVANVIATPCFAMDSYDLILDEIGAAEIVDEIPKEYKSFFQDYQLLTGQGLDTVIENIKIHAIEAVMEEIRIAWIPAAQTMMLIVLCGFLSSFFQNKRGEFSILIVGTTAITYICLGDGKSYFLHCIDLIASSYDFSTVLLPCLAAASVAAGATVSTGVKYTAAALFMNIMLNFSNTVLVPLIGAFLVCKIGDSLFHQPTLRAVADLIRWCCKTALTCSVFVFTAYLSVAGLITGTGEQLATKVMKTTLSTGLPVVGRMISDAASTLVAGASVIRNGVGLLGMLVVITLLIVPLLAVGIRYMIFRAVGACSELYPDNRFKSVIDGIAEAYGMLFAVIGTGAITLLFIILSFMQILGV